MPVPVGSVCDVCVCACMYVPVCLTVHVCGWLLEFYILTTSKVIAGWCVYACASACVSGCAVDKGFTFNSVHIQKANPPCLNELLLPRDYLSQSK